MAVQKQQPHGIVFFVVIVLFVYMYVSYKKKRKQGCHANGSYINTTLLYIQQVVGLKNLSVKLLFLIKLCKKKTTFKQKWQYNK